MTTKDNEKRKISEITSEITNKPNLKKIKKEISDSVLKKYHEKIRAFNFFHPMWLTIGSMCSVEYEPNKYASREEFQDMNIPLEKRIYLKSKNVGFGDIDNSYLWNFNVKEEEDFDEIDAEFMQEQPNFEKSADSGTKTKYTYTKHVFYGLHTYGGYHGFFRPDLNEVINLISEKVKEEDLEGIERIYATTDMYPSSNVNDCFDSKADRHKGKTTIFVVKKQSV